MKSELDLFITWFDRIQTLASKRTTLNDVQMSAEETLSAIEVYAKEAKWHIQALISEKYPL